MKNAEIARVLRHMADLLEIQGADFKPVAYRRAAMNIESLAEDIESIDNFQKIPGVGRHIAEKIKEYLETGKIISLEKLKKQVPVDVDSLMSVEGIGPRKIKFLYEKLGIKNLKDLEKAAKAGKIKNLRGFGEKAEKNIISGTEFAKKEKRMLLGDALRESDEIIKKLQKCKYLSNIAAAGSLRRMKETIGDFDILAISTNPKKAMEFFAAMGKKVLVKGTTKSSVIIESGIQVDMRIVPKKSFGSALNYFTGSKEHNVELRKAAISKGFKLSEYGLFRKNRQIAGRTEKEIYSNLGMEFIEPELRENRGEIRAAAEKRLPKIISYSDVKGDLQMHTNWSDGADSIDSMAKTCENLGHKFMAVTDHAGHLKIAGALDGKRIIKQSNEINAVRKKHDIEIFHGAEVDIDLNGKPELKKEVLESLDVVLVAIHSGLKGDMTERFLTAISDDHVNIIAHPTGRLIQRRPGYSFDFEKVFEAAKKAGVAIEIDAEQNRLDIDDIRVKKAVSMGTKISIGTDAHNTGQLENIRLGAAVARRGWATKKDVINAWNIKKLRKFFGN